MTKTTSEMTVGELCAELRHRNERQPTGDNFLLDVANRLEDELAPSGGTKHWLETVRTQFIELSEAVQSMRGDPGKTWQEEAPDYATTLAQIEAEIRRATKREDKDVAVILRELLEFSFPPVHGGPDAHLTAKHDEAVRAACTWLGIDPATGATVPQDTTRDVAIILRELLEVSFPPVGGGADTDEYLTSKLYEAERAARKWLVRHTKPFPWDPNAGADADNPFGKIVVDGPNGERIRLYLADRVDAHLAQRTGERESSQQRHSTAMTGCQLCGDFPAEFRARCHPTAPLRLEMIEPDKVVVYCYLPTCNREVARLRLAREGAIPAGIPRLTNLQ